MPFDSHLIISRHSITVIRYYGICIFNIQNSDLIVCVDLMGCLTHGAREFQMPNTFRTSVKMEDREATPGKVGLSHPTGNISICFYYQFYSLGELD